MSGKRSVDLVRSRLRDQDKTTDGRGTLEWQGTAAGHLEGTQGGWRLVRLLLCTFYMDIKIIDPYKLQ